MLLLLSKYLIARDQAALRRIILFVGWELVLGKREEGFSIFGKWGRVREFWWKSWLALLQGLTLAKKIRWKFFLFSQYFWPMCSGRAALPSSDAESMIRFNLTLICISALFESDQVRTILQKENPKSLQSLSKNIW